MNLKSQLEHLMKENNVTASKLSTMSGVPKSTISDWLGGTNPKNINQVKKVANYFQVTLDFLCFGEVEEIGLNEFKDEINAGVFEPRRADFTSRTLRVSKSYNKRLRETKSTKASYWRNVPINEDLNYLLLELKNISTSEFILPRLRDWAHGYQAKVLRNFCLSISITPIRFHDLRACFATQLLQNKVPPATVMKVCGWKDLDTMGRYIRLAGIDEQGATKNLSFLPR